MTFIGISPGKQKTRRWPGLIQGDVLESTTARVRMRPWTGTTDEGGGGQVRVHGEVPEDRVGHASRQAFMFAEETQVALVADGKLELPDLDERLRCESIGEHHLLKGGKDPAMASRSAYGRRVTCSRWTSGARRWWRSDTILSPSMRIETNRIDSSSYGFAAIGRIFAAAASEPGSTLEVDCSRLRFIAANMCAPLGAALAGRRSSFTHVSPAVQAILEKNRFLDRLGGRADTYGTTIAYERFQPHQRDDFQEYIQAHFRGKRIPQMTLGLARQFRESLFELFENAVAHSETRLGIFACGQQFPNKNELHFCISDRGVGIPARVRGFLSAPDMSAQAAIDWAMHGSNTTRRVADRLPGGLGLKVVREFIAMNGGAIRVASESGYWWVRGKWAHTERLAYPFPGTAVDIEINTADTKVYALANEINPREIF